MSTTEALHLLQLATKAKSHVYRPGQALVSGLVKLLPHRLKFLRQILSPVASPATGFDGYPASLRLLLNRYRKQTAAESTMDMLYRRYIADELLGEVRAVSCIACTDLRIC